MIRTDQTVIHRAISQSEYFLIVNTIIEVYRSGKVCAYMRV